MASVFCCGFECGQIGSVGQHWNSTGTHAATISTSTIRTGLRSLRANPTAQTTAIITPSVLGSSTLISLRCYVYFATLPTSAQGWVSLIKTTQSGGASYNTITQQIVSAFGNTLGATGVTVVTGQWYRIDVKIDSSANPHLIDVSVDGVACSQVSFALGTQVNSTLEILGQSISNWTGDVFIDDIVATNNTADYPIGAGTVRHFVPTSDGTHTATTTTIVKGTIATPVGANVAGSTDVFNWVSGVPLLGGASDNTRLVNQQTAGSGLYAEVIFGAAPGVAATTTVPRAVEVITADREASTATCNFITKLNDNGTENDVINRGTVAGVVTDRYARKHYALAPTGGAWTITAGAGNFTNIRARFGYSSDATPDIYWRGIMIEAEFAPVSPPSTVLKDIICAGMTIPRAR